MWSTARRRWAAAAALAFFAGAARGEFFSKRDRGTRGPSILVSGAGVRAAGLADAYAGLADDASALYWNPGALNRVPLQEILFSHVQGIAGQGRQFASYVLPFWARGQRRSVGVGLARLAADPFEVVEEGQPVGQARPEESVVSVSYAQPFLGVDLGATVKLVYQRAFEKSAATYAMDLGAAGSAGRFSWGLAMANLGPPLRGDGSSTALPLVVRAGGAYSVLRRPPPSGDALLVVAGLDAPSDDLLVFKTGVEYSRAIRSRWRGALRAGWQSLSGESGAGRFAFGAGLTADKIILNAAYSPQGELGAETRFDMALRFGAKPAGEAKRDALWAQAQSEYAEGRLVKAGETLEALLAHAPGFPPARRLAAELERRFDDSVDPDTLFNQGYHAYQQGNDAAAMDFFQKLLIVEPGHVEGKEWLKKVSDRLSAAKTAQLRESVARAKERQTREAAARAQDAQAKGDWGGALAAWRRVLKLAPGDPPALQGVRASREALLSRAAALEAENPEEALGIYRILWEDEAAGPAGARLDALEARLRRQRAEAGERKFSEGMAAYGAGELARARDLFRQALELLPDDKRARRSLERVENEMKKVP